MIKELSSSARKGITSQATTDRKQPKNLTLSNALLNLLFPLFSDDGKNLGKKQHVLSSPGNLPNDANNHIYKRKQKRYPGTNLATVTV